MSNNGKGNTLWMLATACLALALVVSVGKISQLSERMESLQTTLNNRIEGLQHTVSGLYVQIEDMLENEANILVSAETEYSPSLLEDGSAGVTVKLLPKVITEETTVHLDIMGNTYEAEKVGLGYVVELAVGLFEKEDHDAIVSVTSGGVTHTQEIYVGTKGLCEKYLPTVNGNSDGGSSYTFGKYRFKGKVIVDIINGEESGIVDCRAEVRLNDDVVDTFEIELVEIKSGIYTAELEVNKMYSVSKNDLVGIYVVARDELGYVYENIVSLYDIPDHTDGDNTITTYTNSCVIYDAEGNELYRPY